jgi:hypothetical protein
MTDLAVLEPTLPTFRITKKGERVVVGLAADLAPGRVLEVAGEHVVVRNLGKVFNGLAYAYLDTPPEQCPVCASFVCVEPLTCRDVAMFEAKRIAEAVCVSFRAANPRAFRSASR